MPNYYMHYYFSKIVKDHLSYAGQSAVGLYPEAYHMGAFGFDLFKSMKKLQAELDYKYVYEFFEYASNYVYESGSKIQLAYMLGLMTHYVLDSRMNPYIYFLLEKGVPEYFAQGKAFLTKKQIKDSLEAHIQKIGSISDLEIRITKEEAREISQIFENALPAFSEYEMHTNRIISGLMNLSMPPIKPYKLYRYDYMNRQNANWLTVRNGEWESDMSIDDLLIKLIPIAAKMIDYLIMKIRSAKPLEREWFVLNYKGVLVSR